MNKLFGDLRSGIRKMYLFSIKSTEALSLPFFVRIRNPISQQTIKNGSFTHKLKATFIQNILANR